LYRVKYSGSKSWVYMVDTNEVMSVIEGNNEVDESTFEKLIDGQWRPYKYEWSIRKCKDCGEAYIMPFWELEWFVNNELDAPKRCKSCRYKRRKERYKNEAMV
jgi:hypothetical protein